MPTELTTPGSTESLALDLYQAARGYQARLAARIARMLAQEHGWDVAAGQLGFLGALICGENSPSDIARRLGISRQAAQKQAQDMAAEGYLAMTPDPARRNRSVIVLTDRGAALISACREVLAAMDGDLEADAEALRNAVPCLDRAFQRES